MNVRVLSKAEFDAFMEKQGLNDDNVESSKDYYISIHHTWAKEKPEFPELKPYFKEDKKNLLHMYFDDVLQDSNIMLLSKEAEKTSTKLFAFTEKDGKKLQDFVNKIPAESTIYVHCLMGKSRSVAVGQWLCEKFGIDPKSMYDKPEMESNATVLRILRELEIDKKIDDDPMQMI